MGNTQASKAKYGSVEAGMANYTAEMAQAQTELNQGISKDYYRKRFCELARRLAAANTGQILLAKDDCALWLEGYGEEFTFGDEDEDEVSDFTPIYETYSYNSEAYTICNAKVNKAIMTHCANQLCHSLQEERAALIAQAVELGFPSNLHFLHRDVDIGPSCQTWIIQENGLPRIRDYSVGNTEGKEFREGWAQLLPGEIIASWEKYCMSGPHYFKLEAYIDVISAPKSLACIAEVMPSKKLVHLSIDSRMPALSADQQKVLFNLFSTAQLECLGDLQANIDCAYRDAVDPIYGQSSPDIAGGWLALLGVKQTYTVEVLDDEDIEDDSLDEVELADE